MKSVVYSKSIEMHRLLCSLVLSTVISQFAVGQTRAKTIDSIIEVIHNKNPEVSMSIGFMDNGTDHFFNYGTLSHDSSSKVDEHTIYEIGSVTKLLTGNLMAQAHQEGKLNIDDFIDEYLPKEYKLSDGVKGKLKISDLASHQSGLSDFNIQKLMELKPKQPLDINADTMHSVLNDSTQVLDYGSYRYSNVNYVVMGLILQQVYARDYETLIKEKILLPVQMSNTLTSDFNVKNRVVGYDLQGVEQDFFKWNALMAPAGLIKSTTSDMIKFLKTLLSNKGKVSRATSIAENTFFKNTYREVGFGQQIERHDDDTFFYKTGDTFSGSSILAYDRKGNWGIVIFINQHNSELIRVLINTIYDEVLARKITVN